MSTTATMIQAITKNDGEVSATLLTLRSMVLGGSATAKAAERCLHSTLDSFTRQNPGAKAARFVVSASAAIKAVA